MKLSILILNLALTVVALSKPANVVFFLVDDLGQRDIGCYGSTFYETPNIDRLAKQGALFTNAYAASPVCSPTRASILTGQWPQKSGITQYIGKNSKPAKWKKNTKLIPAPFEDRLSLETQTIAEILKLSDYKTFFAGKWHLGPEGFWPENHGFDINKGGTNHGAPTGKNPYFSPYNNPRLSDGPENEYLPDRLAQETCDFIEANQTKPFFAYFSLYSVHTPLNAPEDLQKKYELKRKALGLETTWAKEGKVHSRQSQEHVIYAAMIESMDLSIGKVLNKLDELNLTNDTLIIFTSDNGGFSTINKVPNSKQDELAPTKGAPTSNIPLRAGKGWLYEGGIREPLIIRWPAKIKAGLVLDTPVSSPDFFPTICEAAESPSKGKTDGISLIPILKGEKASNRSLFWHYPHYSDQGGAPSSAILRDNWKLIQWHENDQVELYNLEKDISETSNLSAQNTELVQSLKSELDEWLKAVDAKFPTTNPAYKTEEPQ